MKKHIQIITIAILMLTAVSYGYSKPHKNTKYLSELSILEKTTGNRKKATAYHKKALRQHLKKNYTASEKLWYQAAKADPAWSASYFNLACSTALQGKKDEALAYAKLALKIDPSKKRIRSLTKDSDLKSIRGTQEFKDLITKYRKQTQTIKFASIKNTTVTYLMPEKQERGNDLHYDEGIIPIGWSKDGKFAYIYNDSINDDVSIQYIVIDTNTNKTVWSYGDTLSEENSLQQSIKNHAKVISHHLNKYKIIQAKGIKLQNFPYKGYVGFYKVDLEIIKKTKAEMENSDDAMGGTIKSMTALITRNSDETSDEILHKDDAGVYSYWVAGYFESPFESKILVAIGRTIQGPGGHLTDFILTAYSFESDIEMNP